MMILAIGIATPASAQVGGTVVLTADVVDKMVTGLKAGAAERDRAQKEDTPYGQYQQAKATYQAAKKKCEAAHQTFPTRMAADEKMAAKYQKVVDQMVAAQTKGDQKAAAAYNDEALAMMDPSCTVKEPKQPDDYYETQRGIDERSEEIGRKTSGLSAFEWAQARERVGAALTGSIVAGDISASEKAAVAARAAELKPLLGIQDAPEKQASKPAPEPAPTPAPAPAPAVPPGATAMSDCMTKNAMKHQAKIEALGNRAQTAQQAGNTAAVMAIADTLQKIQTAGCMAGR